MSFGRLERTPGPAPMSDINMTPLIDVMLVLLVIFMITAPLFVSSVQVDLPKTAGAAPANAPRFITLSLDRSGQAFVDDAPQDMAALERLFTETARRNPDAEVRLRADATVPYGRVVEVMGLAQKAGLSRIGFLADSPSAPSPAGRP